MLRDGGAFYCYNGPEVMALTDAAENIRRLRARAGLTQDALAEKLCVARQTVSSWETGRTEPDIGALEGLAAALGCTTGELLGGAPGDPGGEKKKYRRRILVYGCIALALLLIHAIVRPYLQAYAFNINANAFHPWVLTIAYLTLKIPAFILGTLCVLSAVSVAWGATVGNDPLRRAILISGIVLSVFCIYVICTYICAYFFGVLPSSALLRRMGIFLFQYPAFFAIPVCLIYLGAIKPPRNGTAAK